MSIEFRMIDGRYRWGDEYRCYLSWPRMHSWAMPTQARDMMKVLRQEFGDFYLETPDDRGRIINVRNRHWYLDVVHRRTRIYLQDPTVASWLQLKV